jgi:hypothetical protein
MTTLSEAFAHTPTLNGILEPGDGSHAFDFYYNPPETGHGIDRREPPLPPLAADHAELVRLLQEEGLLPADTPTDRGTWIEPRAAHEPLPFPGSSALWAPHPGGAIEAPSADAPSDLFNAPMVQDAPAPIGVADEPTDAVVEPVEDVPAPAEAVTDAVPETETVEAETPGRKRPTRTARTAAAE